MSNKSLRPVEVVVFSDVHLGTYGSKAKQLHKYMKSIKPEVAILNGDIIDVWQFSKSYFPKSHIKVLRQVLKWVEQGVKVHYVTGNHDELLRRFVDVHLDNFHLVNKVILELDGKKAWVFHGDVFDITMKHTKWIAKMGAKGYGFLILLNQFINWCLKCVGKEKISLSKRIKNKVKGAVKSKFNFEQTAGDLAIEKGYDYVICGHIHQPCIKTIRNKDGAVEYLNSGDWVENMTALEYNEGSWSIHAYQEKEQIQQDDPITNHEEDRNLNENYTKILENMFEREFKQ